MLRIMTWLGIAGVTAVVGLQGPLSWRADAAFLDDAGSKTKAVVERPAAQAQPTLPVARPVVADTRTVIAANESKAEPAKPAASNTGDEKPKQAPRPPVPDTAVALNKRATIYLDREQKRVWLKASVALREGALEQFCCLKQTKEHESVLTLDGKAWEVHAALLALGAKPGSPVRFDPQNNQVHPPHGQRIDIFVHWIDEKGKAQREPGQSWVRNLTRRFYAEKLDQFPAGLKIAQDSELKWDKNRKELLWYGTMSVKQKSELLLLSEDKAYRKVIEAFYEQSQPRGMKASWVFAGSGVFKDTDTGKEYYLAEDGDLICVANFSGAMLDVSQESSAGAEGLQFEAYTERIPPKETPVNIELVPVFENGSKPALPKNGTKPNGTPDNKSQVKDAPKKSPKDNG